jgi:hypothetical protein
MEKEYAAAVLEMMVLLLRAEGFSTAPERGDMP